MPTQTNKELIAPQGWKKTPPTKEGLEAPAAGRGCCGESPPKTTPKRERAAHQNRDPVIIQRRRRVLHQLYPLGEEEESQDSWGKQDGKNEMEKSFTSFWDSSRRKLPELTHAPHDEQLPQEEEEICDFIQHGHPGEKTGMRLCLCSLPWARTGAASGVVFPQVSPPDDVPHQQEKGVPGRGAEVGAINGDLGWEKRVEERQNRGCSDSTTQGKVQIPPWECFLLHCRVRNLDVDTPPTQNPPQIPQDVAEIKIFHPKQLKNTSKFHIPAALGTQFPGNPSAPGFGRLSP